MSTTGPASERASIGRIAPNTAHWVGACRPRWRPHWQFRAVPGRRWHLAGTAAGSQHGSLQADPQSAWSPSCPCVLRTPVVAERSPGARRVAPTNYDPSPCPQCGPTRDGAIVPRTACLAPGDECLPSWREPMVAQGLNLATFVTVRRNDARVVGDLYPDTPRHLQRPRQASEHESPPAGTATASCGRPRAAAARTGRR